jgi:hypothetical protein
MKKYKIGIILIIMFLSTTKVYAAGSASISASNTVVNGNNITATVTLKDMAAWNINITGSGATNGCSTKEVGDSGNGQNTTKKFYLTCKANKLGTITFNFSGDITSSDGVNKTVSGSKKVTVVKPREKSTNNNLKSLSVEGYTLSPEFNADTLEYTVELEASVEKIMVNAEKADSYASISGGGEIAVSEGDNRIEIKVTSETGKEKVYVINAVVKDSNPITTTVEDKKLTVVKKASSLTKPDLFEETKIKINEMEIPAFYNEATKTTLVGLRDENGKIELYIYDQDKNSYQKYLTLVGTEFHLIQKEAKGIPEGYQKVTKKIDDIEYTAYQKDKSDFLLLYGTILENGNEGWYSYDTKEKTLQRYNKDIVESMTKEYQDIQDTDHKVIIGLAVLSSVLALTTMILALRKPRVKKVNNKERKEEISENKKSKAKKGNQKKNDGKEKEENVSNE